MIAVSWTNKSNPSTKIRASASFAAQNYEKCAKPQRFFFTIYQYWAACFLFLADGFAFLTEKNIFPPESMGFPAETIRIFSRHSSNARRLLDNYFKDLSN